MRSRPAPALRSWAPATAGLFLNGGSFLYDDPRNIFYNPAYVNDFKNWGNRFSRQPSGCWFRRHRPRAPDQISKSNTSATSSMHPTNPRWSLEADHRSNDGHTVESSHCSCGESNRHKTHFWSAKCQFESFWPYNHNRRKSQAALQLSSSANSGLSIIWLQLTANRRLAGK